jgi:hemolysin III
MGASIWGPMSHIRRHADPTFKSFLKRTVSAQLHLAGLVAAILGLAVLLHYVGLKGEPDHYYACLAFGLTSILVFAVSTFYHFLSDGYVISPKLYHLLEDLDHFSIFLFIAGTYTPFILNVIRPPWQTPLLILIWTMGFVGIVYTHYRPRLPMFARHRIVYTTIFLIMGWTLLIRIGEAIENLSFVGLCLLVGGGLSYSIGAVFYALKRPNLIKDLFGFHELWHVMVLGGFGLHYFLILSFYRPL